MTSDAFGDALVLYVDDDASNRTAFEYVFRGRFRFRIAASGEQALEMIRDESPAVLLSDHRMAGMTGVELCQRVRKQSPETIRMILTAYADLNAVAAAINQGAVHRYLRKPYDDDQLCQALASGIARWRERRDLAQLEGRVIDESPAHVARLTELRIWHEMRNFIGPLYTHIQLLDEAVQECDTAEAASIVAELYGICANLQGYNERLRATPIEESCDGAEIVRRATRLFQRDNPQPLLTLSITATGRLPIGMVPLTQVLYNLLKNAQRFGASRVDVRMLEHDNTILVEVQDDGPGISAELAKQIFDDRFTTHSDGHGLGLSTSRQLVEQGGGTLTLVKTTIGACFQLAFQDVRA